MRRTASASLALTAALLVSACGSDTAPGTGTGNGATTPVTSMSPTGPASPSAGETMRAGAYLSLTDFTSQMASREGTKIVYFFHASWCPDCRATERSINASGVPAGLTIVKIDYDTETDLRKKYGITQQHTFVQVDPDGAELATWTGTTSGADIMAKTL